MGGDEVGGRFQAGVLHGAGAPPYQVNFQKVYSRLEQFAALFKIRFEARFPFVDRREGFDGRYEPIVFSAPDFDNRDAYFKGRQHLKRLGDGSGGFLATATANGSSPA